MEALAKLRLSTFDGDDELSSDLLTCLSVCGPILQPSDLCIKKPAEILCEIANGSIYVDSLMGIVVSRVEILKSIHGAFSANKRSLEVAENSVLTALEDNRFSSGSKHPRFWYVRRLGGWPGQTGIGQRVALIDTGISGNHHCLTRFTPDDDFTSLERGVTSAQDRSDHGTCCAGIIGARSNCDERIGVASDCRLIVGQILPGVNSDRLLSVEWALLTSWALHCRGARVISLSYGIKKEKLSAAINVNVYSRVATRLRQRNAALVFCSAGKRGPVVYPAAAKGMVAVGAYQPAGSDYRKIVASSNSGGVSEAPAVDSQLILGPGVELVTTGKPTIAGGPCVTELFGGTSGACAFVAGVAALYMEGYPTWTVEQILAQMFADAEDVPHPSDPNRSFKGIRFPRAANRECC